MLEIIGETGTNEYSAAIEIAASLINLWPGIEKSPATQELVRISANVKISGYRVSDIDVVVCGVFYRERKFIASQLLYDTSGKRIIRAPITVKNFVVVVEVKEHSEGSVQFIGDKVSVKYSRNGTVGWKSATDQNIDQVHSLHPYLKDLGFDVYVYRCLFMRGLSHIDIAGSVASGFTGPDFLSSIAKVTRIQVSSNGYFISSGLNESIQSILNAPIFRVITPTALDRRRMDMIVANTLESEEVFLNIGKKMIQLRGHGGTGKTIMLLQAAWKAYTEKGLRTLVLTYNHALAADIRRILALMNVPSNPEDGGITVITVMSFLISWLTELGVIDQEEDFSYDDYNKYCLAALELFSALAIDIEDVNQIIKSKPDHYDFDIIMIDEAQDWPQSEVDLLKLLYTHKNLCLADGVDQLIRGKRPNWLKDIESFDKVLIALNTCLRMKRNLAVFANQVAEDTCVNWNVNPNNLAGGGKIIVLLKPYFECYGLHDTLISEAKIKGNAELDFLFCVPSNSVKLENNKKQSDIAKSLSESGFTVWDGVDDTIRKDFPRSKKQFRVVQYASCRGLEGWTVVLHNADIYWQECLSFKNKQGLTTEEILAYEDLEDIAYKQAWLRLMIALTRPIDTLVIGLNNQHSDFSKIILNIANKNSDYIQIIQ